MSQIASYEKASIIDFYGQPSIPSNPPVGEARMFYDDGNNTFHVIDSNGVDLLGGGGVTSVAGKVGVVTLIIGDIIGLTAALSALAPLASPTFTGTVSSPIFSTGHATWTEGSGSPEGVVTAPIGSIYSNLTGTTATALWKKEATAGPTGWTAVA